MKIQLCLRLLSVLFSEAFNLIHVATEEVFLVVETHISLLMSWFYLCISNWGPSLIFHSLASVTSHHSFCWYMVIH